jgi:hypothetical protein
MSLKEATNVKNQRLPALLGLGIATKSPTGYSRLINGFPALSSTSDSYFVHKTIQRRVPRLRACAALRGQTANLCAAAGLLTFGFRFSDFFPIMGLRLRFTG